MKILFVAVLALMILAGGALAGDKDALLSSLQAGVTGSAEASDAVKTFVTTTLIPLCTDPVLVAEVKAQNAKKVDLAEIQKIDEEWKNAEDELPIHVEKTSNVCAHEIRKIVAANPAIVEAFAMDDQGANVGQNALTSDYWQGDEAKWKNSFNGGQGGVDIGKVDFDKSTNAQLQQVSLPIIDENGVVVGAITYGIAVGRL